jgi:CTP:molybdopterin cytidylyltransferase MocA
MRVRYNAGMPLSVVILAAGQGKRMNSTCRGAAAARRPPCWRTSSIPRAN